MQKDKKYYKKQHKRKKRNNKITNEKNNKSLEELNKIEQIIKDFSNKQKKKEKFDADSYIKDINNIIEKYYENDNEKEKTKVKTTDKKEKDNKEYPNLKDNLELIVSEEKQKVYLPYTRQEILNLLKEYPEDFESPEDVIEKEYIVDISIYNQHPYIARFREAYSLARNKEMKSILESFQFARSIMFRSDINPTIIAAVKSESQLEKYIECLDNNKLEDFNCFKIKFEVNPI